MSLLEFANRFRFDSVDVIDRGKHLPPAVAAALPEEGAIVFLVADDDSDTAAFSQRYGFGLEDCANTIVLRYTKDRMEQYAAIVTLGSRRLDVNGAVKEVLGAKRLSFAKREVATEITGMEFGGITAFGLPSDMRILVDAEVMKRQFVVVGAGCRESKILLDPAVLSKLPNTVVSSLTVPQPEL
ncbi:YbaK/EbsC family protein [Cupriavidus basilensis]